MSCLIAYHAQLQCEISCATHTLLSLPCTHYLLPFLVCLVCARLIEQESQYQSLMRRHSVEKKVCVCHAVRTVCKVPSAVCSVGVVEDIRDVCLVACRIYESNSSHIYGRKVREEIGVP